MALVLPNQGLPDLLTWLLKSTSPAPPDLVFTLFFNDLTPTQATVLADLDRVGFGGFQEQVLNRSGWTVPVIVSDQAVSTWGVAPTEWTVASDPLTVYGWAAYIASSLRLVIVERFDVPRPLAVGDILGLLPRFTLTTAPS